MRMGDLLLPLLLLGAFILTAVVITVTDTASAYGGYLGILFVGMTYPLPWNRISWVAAAVASLALIYWSSTSFMSRQDAMAGLAISLLAVWAIAFAIARIQKLETGLDTRDKQLALSLEASELGIFHWDLKTNRVHDQGKLRELWGIPHDGPIYSRDIVRRVHEDDAEMAQAAIARALRGEGDYSAEFRIRDERTGKIRWLLGRGRVIQTLRSRRLYLTGTNLDITALKEEEMRIRSILNGLGVLAGLVTPEGTLLQANSTALETAKLEPEDVIGKPIWDTWWFSHDRIEQTRLQQAVDRAARGEKVQYDATIRIAGEETATIAFFLSPVRDSNGEVVYLVPSAIDITDRKQAEDQVNILVQELNHRIKNLFSVTNALINLSARHATDLDSFVQSTLRRLQALHASHTMTGADVTRPKSYYASVDAEALAVKVLAPFRIEREDRIVIKANGMDLDAGQATAFSLILNELIANSIKYGALSAENGMITLEWSPHDHGYDFRWRESGGPVIDSFEGKGFGHSIISLLTINYLDGECRFGVTDGGLDFSITVRDDAEEAAAE